MAKKSKRGFDDDDYEDEIDLEYRRKKEKPRRRRRHGEDPEADLCDPDDWSDYHKGRR